MLPHQQPVAQSNDATSMRPRILIIEDDADVAEALGMHFGSTSGNADVVMDGVAGVGRALSRRYDAIVLDVTMPGIGRHLRL